MIHSKQSPELRTTPGPGGSRCHSVPSSHTTLKLLAIVLYGQCLALKKEQSSLVITSQPHESVRMDTPVKTLFLH